MTASGSPGWTTPVDSPCYPRLPARYTDVFFQFVFFRADPAAVARLLPPPLQAAPDGRCVAIGLRVPECSAYGAFEEAVVQPAATFDGQPGWYCSHVWHNGPAGIAAGREIYGTPKFMAHIDHTRAGPAAQTRAGTGGRTEILVRSHADIDAGPDQLPPLAPSWRLKWIPRADGPGAAVHQLVDGSTATQDLRVAWCRRGQGTVAFSASEARDLTGLTPRAYDGAFQLCASYAEGFATVVHDYLS